MDPRSENSLVGVHPVLVEVMRAAAQSPAFVIIHGLRDAAEEAAMVAKHASTTMHSRHLANRQGYACAVDVMALVDGHCSWEPVHYAAINDAVQAAATALNVLVEWGGAWTTFKDLGHFQLPWAQYP